MSFQLNYKSFLLGAVSAAALATPAFALDGKDMMDKIVAAYAVYGANISYDQAQASGNTVTVTGIKVKSPDPKKPGEVPLGNVTFNNVAANANGGYTIGSVRFKDIDSTERQDNGTVHFSATGLEIDGVTVPAKPGTDSLDGILLFKAAQTGPIKFEQDGKQVFQIASITAKAEVASDQSQIDSDSKISGIAIDLSTVKDPKAKANIEKLGLTTLNGNMVMKGSWNVKSGKLDVTEESLDLQNVGKLNMTFSLSGYTLAFIKTVRETMDAAQANPDKEAAKSAMGIAMMGLMQQLTFNGASIRFDDASITKRVLDLVGTEQGVTGDQLAQSIKGMLPLMMTKLNMPAFQAQVSSAVNAYLDNPKNIEIKAAPLNPVAVPVIMGAGMGAPQTLPQVLGVTVTANQ